VDQDLDAFTGGIVRYITKTDRRNSPKYLFGESYLTDDLNFDTRLDYRPTYYQSGTPWDWHHKAPGARGPQTIRTSRSTYRPPCGKTRTCSSIP
jgi:hypothetical protein